MRISALNQRPGYPALRRTVLGALAVLLLGASPEPAVEPAQVIAVFAERGKAIKSTSFDMHVDVRLKTPPWLHFSVDGTGGYERGGQTTVHFTKVPWFAKGYETVSLAQLDVRNWPDIYDVVSATREGDQTKLVMREKVYSTLKDMRVTVDAQTGVRSVFWSYRYGGKIAVDITPAQIEGQLLPAREDADVLLPVAHAEIHAVFSNYRVVVDERPGATDSSKASGAPSNR